MIKNIFSGLNDYRYSLQIIRQLGLWSYFFIPALISLLLALGITISAWGLSDNLGQWIDDLWIWEWGKDAAAVVSEVLGGLLILALGILLYKHMVLGLSAPFMGPVSEKIEGHLTGEGVTEKKGQFFKLLYRGMRISIRNLIMELFFTIPILLLSLIPVIGILSTAFLFLLQSYYAGFGNMDYTLERHYSFSQSIKKVRDHSGVAIGNGIPFMLLLLIPVLGVLIVLPLSVTAATISSTKLIHPVNNLKIST